MELIVLFVDVCLFKKGPQDVPASRILFALTLLAYWIVGVLLLSLQNDWLDSVLQALTESLLLFAFCGLILWVARRPNRFLPTVTALFGTDALISLPGALLLSLWLVRPDSQGLQLALLGLTLWHLAVIAHIYRHAVSKPLSAGIVLAVLYIGLTYGLMAILFDIPVVEPEGGEPQATRSIDAVLASEIVVQTKEGFSHVTV